MLHSFVLIFEEVMSIVSRSLGKLMDPSCIVSFVLCMSVHRC